MTMRTMPCVVTFLSVLCAISTAVADPGGVSAATQTFLDTHPGTRAMFQGERMVAIYGSPFANDSNVASSTDDFVGAFLQQNASALGVDNPTLVLKNSIVIRNGTMKVYTYTQQIEGLPVYGSVVKIPVHLGVTERIGYVGMHLSQTPANPLPGDILSGAQAIAVVDDSQQYGHLTTFGPASKMIYERPNGTLHRTWRFSGSGGEESYVFMVDTNSGSIIAAINQVLNDVDDVTGIVEGYHRACCPPNAPGWPACCGAPGCHCRCVPLLLSSGILLVREDPAAENSCGVG
jgi:Zn-dependent metalloprotease